MRTCLKPIALIAVVVFFSPFARGEGADCRQDADSQAQKCERRFQAASEFCNKFLQDGVSAERTCKNGEGFTQSKLEVAACLRRQAAEYEKAYTDCLEDAQQAKGVCAETQETVKDIDGCKTNENATSKDPSISTAKHVPIKETVETGRQSLPELVAPNNTIHDSWHGADGLQSKTAQDLKQHAQALRDRAAVLEVEARKQTGVTSVPPAETAKTADAPTAAPTPQQAGASAAPKAAEATEKPKAVPDQDLVAAQAAGEIQSTVDPSASTGTAAGTLYGGQQAAMPASTSASDSDFVFGSMAKAASSESAGASSAAASSASGMSSSGDSVSPSGSSSAAASARAPASVAAGSSGSGGSRGGRAMSLIGENDSKNPASSAPSAIAAAEAKAANVDLSQFLPGARRASGLDKGALGIHGPHVNFFNKVNERYHYLEDSLDP